MGDYKIYLGNIPDDCRERDVEKFFKGYGKIRNIVLKVSLRTRSLMYVIISLTGQLRLCRV